MSMHMNQSIHRMKPLWLIFAATICAVTFFAFPRSSHAAISLVESRVATSSNIGTTLSQSFTSTPASGNLVAVAVSVDVNTVTSVTDNQGNTYALADSAAIYYSSHGYFTTVHLYYAKNVTSAGTFTVTANFGGGGVGHFGSIAIMNYSGIDTSNPLDQVRYNNGFGGTQTSGNLTSTVNGELFLAAMSTSANDWSITPSAPWTSVYDSPGTLTEKQLDIAQIIPNATTTGATWNGGSSDMWGAVMATFRPAGTSPSAISLIDSNYVFKLSGSPVTSASTSFNVAIPSGSTVIAAVLTSAPLTSITDNQGNTYRTAVREMSYFSSGTNINYLGIFYAANVSSTGTFTITATQASANDISIVIADFTGLDQYYPLDTAGLGEAVLGSASFPQIFTGKVTGSQDNELYFALGTNVSPDFSVSADNDWHGINFLQQNDSNLSFSTVYAVRSATTSEATWTLSGDDKAVAGIITVFRPPQQTSSTLDSATFDTGASSGVQLNSLLWQGSKPAGTTVQFQIAVSNASSGPWSYFGSDGTSNTYFSPAAGTPVTLPYAATKNYRYFRYRVFMVSDITGALLPRIDDVSINWSP